MWREVVGIGLCIRYIRLLLFAKYIARVCDENASRICTAGAQSAQIAFILTEYDH